MPKGGIDDDARAALDAPDRKLRRSSTRQTREAPVTKPFVEHGTGWSKVHYCDGDRPTEQDRAHIETAINAPAQLPAGSALPSSEEQLADYVYSVQNYTDAKEVAAHLWPVLSAAQPMRMWEAFERVLDEHEFWTDQHPATRAEILNRLLAAQPTRPAQCPSAGTDPESADSVAAFIRDEFPSFSTGDALAIARTITDRYAVTRPQEKP